MQSKVSMVMPVYNKIKYIDIMLESVYNQRWDNIELIMVNDGATDGTRERISEWEPRFQERGYEVLIIDQENQGIPSAVKSGLERISGEYVCLCDCDDELDPEYVSTMAGWLDGHQEDQWTACTFNKISVENGVRRVISTESAARIPSPPLMLEKYLSGHFICTVWIYMVRSDYLRTCRVTERFVTDIRATQEPGFLFPLAVGGGRLKVLPYPLYNHNIYPEQTSAYYSAAYKVKFQDLYRDAIIKTIMRLEIEPSEKRKLAAMAKLLNKRNLLIGLQAFSDGGEYIPRLARETAELISGLFEPDPGITAEHIEERDYTYLSLAITDCIFGNGAYDLPAITGRVIGCGALGKIGLKRIPALKGTMLEPALLWDNSAAPNDDICNIPVTAPDYSNLTPEDTVLIFPRDKHIKADLVKIMNENGVEKLIFDEEICSAISLRSYPQFYGKCKFS